MGEGKEQPRHRPQNTPQCHRRSNLTTGVMHFRVRGTRGKIRFVPVHAMTQRLIEECLALAGDGADTAGPVFRPVTNKAAPRNWTGCSIPPVLIH
jgi:hypothetical protein